MCETATNNLRLLLEFEQQGKADIDACLSNHKEKFTDLFVAQAEENRQSVQNAIETKAKFAEQTEQLENELRVNFNTFITDQSRISDLVSSILVNWKWEWPVLTIFFIFPRQIKGENATVTLFCENCGNIAKLSSNH